MGILAGHMSSKNLEVLRRAVEAFNENDAEAMQALCTPDVEFLPLRAVLEGTVYRGPGAAAQMLADFIETWDDLYIDVEGVREAGESLLVSARFRGHGRLSGADIDTKLALVYRFEAGKIASMRTYIDRAEAVEAVGLRE